MKKEKCNLCGYEISVTNIKKHKEYCNGEGPKRLRKKTGRGQGWNKGMTLPEEQKLKISEALVGNPKLGRAETKEAEKIRKHKIAVAMKGNKNGATAFRRQNIKYAGVHFKSKWEVNTAKFFDSNEIKWKYEDKTYDLSETTSYNPDFSLYENEIFIKHIEVKGYFRPENKEKFEKFKRMYPNVEIELWDKQILLKNKIPLV
jgi:hypothetical protein